MGSEQEWKLAQKALAEALKKKESLYQEMPGEAVFYGPKIDIYIVDASGKIWQCSTIQFGFNLPERFNIAYTGSDGEPHEVVMIHRALLGTIERFFAILLEHYKGSLPVWLAPTQVRVLPIGNNYVQYAREVRKKLSAYGIRTEVDDSDSTISYKIREAEIQKIPYMAVCGKREAKSKEMAVRKHGVGDIGMLTIKELVKNIKKDAKPS